MVNYEIPDYLRLYHLNHLRLGVVDSATTLLSDVVRLIALHHNDGILRMIIDNSATKMRQTGKSKLGKFESGIRRGCECTYTWLNFLPGVSA